jgi:hypothetical protein
MLKLQPYWINDNFSTEKVKQYFFLNKFFNFVDCLSVLYFAATTGMFEALL